MAKIALFKAGNSDAASGPKASVVVANDGRVTFLAIGAGTGRWRAHVAFAEVLDGVVLRRWDAFVTDANPIASVLLDSNNGQLAGWLVEGEGTFAVGGFADAAEGAASIAMHDFGLFASSTDRDALPTAFLATGTRATVLGTEYTWGGAAVGWVRAIATPRIISSLGGFRTTIDAMSNGTTQVGGTDRIPFTVFGDASDVQCVFVNGRVSSSGMIAKTGNDITVKASIDADGAPVCVPFGFAADAASGVTVLDGGFVETKPLPIALKSGATYYLRTYKTAPAGGKWPYVDKYPIGSTTTDVTNGTSAGTGNDITENYGGAAVTADTTLGGFFPTALIGILRSPVLVHQIQGDSIANGAGASKGYLQTAIDSIPNHVHHTDAFSGSAIINNNKFDIVAAHLSQYTDSVILHIGTNDLSIPLISDLQTYIAEIDRFMLRNSRTGKIYICTILPSTTSSDSWTTASGQSVKSFESLRVQINNWLRSSLASHALSLGFCAGVIDGCVGYEKNANGTDMQLSNGTQQLGTGGRHPANCTVDGIHPNDTAVAILAPIAAAQIK